VIYRNILSHHSPGSTEESNETIHQSVKTAAVSGQRFEYEKSVTITLQRSVLHKSL